MAKKLIDLVTKKFGDAVLDSHSRLGNDTVVVDRGGLRELAEYLRDDEATQMNMLRDITAVDYMNRSPRFEVVYVFYSLQLKHQLLVRVPLDANDAQVASLATLWGCAGWLEREVYDMYGVIFTDHPDLRRVLLYDEFEGYPLRKDYHQQHSQPRTELLARERDSVEEFMEYVKDEPATGSRSQE